MSKNIGLGNRSCEKIPTVKRLQNLSFTHTHFKHTHSPSLSFTLPLSLLLSLSLTLTLYYLSINKKFYTHTLYQSQKYNLFHIVTNTISLILIQTLSYIISKRKHYSHTFYLSLSLTQIKAAWSKLMYI